MPQRQRAPLRGERVGAGRALDLARERVVLANRAVLARVLAGKCLELTEVACLALYRGLDLREGAWVTRQRCRLTALGVVSGRRVRALVLAAGRVLPRLALLARVGIRAARLLVAALALERRLELVARPRTRDDGRLPVDADVDLGREAAWVVACAGVGSLGALDAGDHLLHVTCSTRSRVEGEVTNGLELRQQVLIEQPCGLVLLCKRAVLHRDQVLLTDQAAAVADGGVHSHAVLNGTAHAPRRQHDLGREVGVVLAIVFHELLAFDDADAVCRLARGGNPLEAALRPTGARGVRHLEVVVLPLAVGHGHGEHLAHGEGRHVGLRHRGRGDLVVHPAAVEGRGVVSKRKPGGVCPPHAADPDAIRATAARAQIDGESEALGVVVEHSLVPRRPLQVAGIREVGVGATRGVAALGDEHERGSPLGSVDAGAEAVGVDVERDRALARRLDLEVGPLRLEQVARLRVGRSELLGRLGDEEVGVHECRAVIRHAERDVPRLVLAFHGDLVRAGRTLDDAEGQRHDAVVVDRAACQDERQRTLPRQRGASDRRGVPQHVQKHGRAARRFVAVHLGHHDQVECVAGDCPRRLRHLRLYVQTVDRLDLDLQHDVAASLHGNGTRLAGRYLQRA